MFLSVENIEYSTPLWEDTHAIKGVYIWLFIDLKIVGVTKLRYLNQKTDIMLIDLNNMKTIKHNIIFDETRTHLIIKTIELNESLIENYISGELCAKDLVENFKKFN